MKNRKPVLIVLMLTIMITFTSNSGFEEARAIDIVQLVAFGTLLGIFISNKKEQTE